MATSQINFEQNTAQVVNSYTIGDLLNMAYRLAHALKNPGQGIGPSELTEGLLLLNSMINGWRTERLMVVFFIRTIVPFKANQQSYGVGPGQDWDVARPTRIDRAGFIVGTDSSPAEISMDIVLTHEQWSAFTIKKVQDNVPLALYYQASYPYGTARLWPVPNQDGTMAIYTPQWLSEVKTADDPLITPDGYRDMMIYGLAVRIHQLYPEKPWEPSVAADAEFYKQKVKSNQFTPLFIGTDAATLQEGWGQRFIGGDPKAWSPY